MAYQRITRKSLVERWNKVMRQIGHDHFCVPNSEIKITCYKDMLYEAEFVYDGFDDDFRDGYDEDNKSMFYRDKAKMKRLLDWLRNAPIDDDVKNGLLFETNTTKSKRGGYRKGSGRPATGRTRAITIRVSEEAVKKLNTLGVNKSEYIDNLIRKA